MNIGQTIIKLRKIKGLKQIELAEQSGISQTYLSQIEGGNKVPKIDILEKISNVLEIPFSVMSFLSLDKDSIPKDKEESFTKIKPILDGFIKEIFLAE